MTVNVPAVLKVKLVVAAEVNAGTTCTVSVTALEVAVPAVLLVVMLETVVAMAVLEATEALAGVFKLTALQKLVTVVPEALVVLEEPEEREAMEPTE